MAAVVHHGGAGTTAAGLRAGVPSIVVPFFADQPFWADRVRKLGVGPTPISRKRLTAEKLSEAILEAVGSEDIRARASSIGERIRDEDGVANAVEALGELLPVLA
jgi:sterol 3beta-glucosyltransferase